MSCLKRTLARVLIIIVSVGYGVVKPRLGSTLNQVLGVGFVYYVFSAVEALARVSKVSRLLADSRLVVFRHVLGILFDVQDVRLRFLTHFCKIKTTYNYMLLLTFHKRSFL